MLAAVIVTLATLMVVWVGLAPAAFADDGAARRVSVVVADPPVGGRPVVPQPEAAPPAFRADVVRTGLDVAWLVPLGAGLVILGALFVVIMRRHRHDDLD